MVPAEGRLSSPSPPRPQVRITSQGKSRSYISYGTSLLTEKGHSSVVLKAMGKAINKTVTIGVQRSASRSRRASCWCPWPARSAAAMHRPHPDHPPPHSAPSLQRKS